MATLKDVAKLACCDVSTVSRALNNTSYVHPDTKARILAAVKELSYHPNVLAQGLRQGKKHTIGVITPGLSMTVFSEILQGIEEEARYMDYSTLVCNSEDNPEIERECLNRLRNGFIDGLIIAGTGKSGRILRDMNTNGIPVVQIVRKLEEGISSVSADFESTGYNAVKYLVERGCREIGFINGPMNLAPYYERYKGYCRAIKKYGLTEICASPFEPVNSFEGGFYGAEELLRHNHHLDAIMVALDIQGIGALRALKESRLSVPDDIKLISLTGHSIGGMLETTLTSIEVPAKEMGRNATQMVIKSIAASSASKPEPQHLTFNTTLIERESC